MGVSSVQGIRSPRPAFPSREASGAGGEGAQVGPAGPGPTSPQPGPEHSPQLPRRTAAAPAAAKGAREPRRESLPPRAEMPLPARRHLSSAGPPRPRSLLLRTGAARPDRAAAEWERQRGRLRTRRRAPAGRHAGLFCVKEGAALQGLLLRTWGPPRPRAVPSPRQAKSRQTENNSFRFLSERAGAGRGEPGARFQKLPGWGFGVRGSGFGVRSSRPAARPHPPL